MKEGLGAFRVPGRAVSREGQPGIQREATGTVCGNCGNDTFRIFNVKDPDCGGASCHLQCTVCQVSFCGDGIEDWIEQTEEEKQAALQTNELLRFFHSGISQDPLPAPETT